MRNHGTLAKWNDDRGFGFISPAGGGNELFVHVSAFPHDGRRPTLGEVVSYEVETGGDGKSRAVNLMRPGRKPRTRNGRHGERQTKSPGVIEAVIAVLVLGLIAGYGYVRLGKPDSASPTATTRTPVAERIGSPFKCDGRTMCSQMTSCDEARYFVRHCPDTKMDGNHDGEPCEQQWCSTGSD